MKKHCISIAILIVFCFSIQAFTESPGAKGKRVSIEQDTQPKFQRVKANIILKIYGSDGRQKFAKKLVMAQYTKNLGKWNEIESSITYFKSPADDRGNAFLAYNYKNREDAKYVYLKGIRKAKKVAGASKKTSFFGSDFFTNDMGIPDVKEWTYRYLGPKKVKFKGRNFTTMAVLCTAVNPNELGYSKKVVYMYKASRKSYLTLMIKYYDLNKSLFKIMRLKSFLVRKNIKGQRVFYTTGLEMKNVQRGTRTELLIKNIKPENKSGVKPHIFTVQYLSKRWW
ncbi:outer membrane lipoprotein-sorting protein [Spirochaetota bacterium]